jgi:hypothetical protein
MTLTRWPMVFTMGVLAAAAGCVDLSPVAFEAPEGGALDARDDAPPDGPSADALAADCTSCLSTGPCSVAWTACTANDQCGKFAACMSASLCWAASLTDLANLSPCLISCATAAGIMSQNSPAAVLISPVYTCAQNPAQCEPACIPGGDR